MSREDVPRRPLPVLQDLLTPSEPEDAAPVPWYCWTKIEKGAAIDGQVGPLRFCHRA